MRTKRAERATVSQGVLWLDLNTNLTIAENFVYRLIISNYYFLQKRQMQLLLSRAPQQLCSLTRAPISSDRIQQFTLHRAPKHKGMLKAP